MPTTADPEIALQRYSRELAEYTRRGLAAAQGVLRNSPGASAKLPAKYDTGNDEPTTSSSVRQICKDLAHVTLKLEPENDK